MGRILIIEKALKPLDSEGHIAEIEKPKCYFVLGGPGSGKGTNCANLVRDFGYIHLSAGDLLREEMKTGSKEAKFIKETLNDGRCVPVEISCNLVKKAMEKNGWAKKQFLIDGFPRNEDNRIGWNKVMGDIT